MEANISILTEVNTILDSRVDKFNGILINPKKLPKDRNEFDTRLCASLALWQTDGRRGIWLHVDIENSELLPVAVKYGFHFHHAVPSHVMLTKWLPTSEDSKLPDYASHTIGVGGFVLTDDNKLLIVSERYNLLSTVNWKLPGGYVQSGETLAQAATREVKEECGINTEFVSIVCFRHQHPGMFDRSDIYFICRLRPLTFDLVPEESEIAECKWVDLETYVNDPSIFPLNRTIAKMVLQNVKGHKQEIKPQQVDSVMARTFAELYSVPDTS